MFGFYLMELKQAMPLQMLFAFYYLLDWLIICFKNDFYVETPHLTPTYLYIFLISDIKRHLNECVLDHESCSWSNCIQQIHMCLFLLCDRNYKLSIDTYIDKSLLFRVYANKEATKYHIFYFAHCFTLLHLLSCLYVGIGLALNNVNLTYFSLLELYM